jgi:hypothetical protein
VEREFGSAGDIVYELQLETGGKLHSVTASKGGSQCDGFFAGDEGIATTYTASTITLTRGKFTCRLRVRGMR